MTSLAWHSSPARSASPAVLASVAGSARTCVGASRSGVTRRIRAMAGSAQRGRTHHTHRHQQTSARAGGRVIQPTGPATRWAAAFRATRASKSRSAVLVGAGEPETQLDWGGSRAAIHASRLAWQAYRLLRYKAAFRAAMCLFDGPSAQKNVRGARLFPFIQEWRCSGDLTVSTESDEPARLGRL